MEFRIADTFTDSLAKLTGDEQKAVKTTAFDLQLNPSNPGMSLHKIDKAKDKNFWSVRVSSDLRIIIHKTKQSFLLCYVGHHDPAYHWASRRKLETHPNTGAAQLVEVRETIQEISFPIYVPVESPAPSKPPLFAGIDPGTDFYFVHGYHLNAAAADDVQGRTPYCGGFVSAIAKDNFFGVQFHPEKSQKDGFRLLANFLRL